MAYLIAAGICAVPLLALCCTGKLYFWRFFKLRHFRRSESPTKFSAYLVLCLFFPAFFCYKGVQEVFSGQVSATTLLLGSAPLSSR